MEIGPSASQRALSLRERLASRQTGRVPQGFDVERAMRRASLWKSQSPFDQADFFEQRLAAEGLTRTELESLLGEVPDATTPEPQEMPSWAAPLEEAFSESRAAELQLPLPPQWKNLVGHEFWVFVEPILRGPFEVLASQLEELCTHGELPPLPPSEIRDLLVRTIPYEFLGWPLRTMVLELNVSRLQGDLKSPEAQGRFLEFIDRLNNPKIALQLLREYAVLARQLVDAAETWRSTTSELFERLVRDWPLIAKTFEGCDPEDVLSGVRVGAGDRHRGGRTVAVLSFQSGFKVVYKPRPLAVDSRFQRVLLRLNEWGCQPPFLPVTILERQGYGWMEYVRPRGCTTPAEARLFYERQGGYLALLYLLRASDIHFENVIACGEHPVVIDLESLLSPGPVREVGLREDILIDSIVRVGLLPFRAWENKESAGLDVSALGGPDGQLPPRPEPYWEDRGSDQMHYARRSRQIEASNEHRPTLEGRPLSALDYTAEILGGFERTYRLLLDHRDQLLDPRGPLVEFEQQEVRVLLRSTAVYSLMLRESFHPDYLRDGLDRERFLDKLWVQVPQRPSLRRVISLEKADLWRGDIPMFTASANSRSIRAGDGEVLEEFFTASAMDLVYARLAGFGEGDLKRQLWFARASMAILSTASPERERGNSSVPEGALSSSASPARLAHLASKIGDRLCEESIQDGDKVRWLGLMPVRQGSFKIALLNENLYSGLAGVTHFLAYLGHLRGEAKYTRVAQTACQTLLQSLRQESDVATRVGAFDGLGGVVYLLSHLAALWNQPSLLDEGLSMVDLIAERIEADKSSDVVSGSAGCILGLSSLYRLLRVPQVLDAMIRCGRQLGERAIETLHGIGWLTTGESPVPMTGFAHGSAGIAAALFELAELSASAEFRDLASRALSYERNLFCAEEGNWPDLRAEKDRFRQVNWCHGAPGIGLGRLRILGSPGSEGSHEEIEAALGTTLKYGFGRNHSLCHGDLGNLDLLLSAKSTLGDPRIDQDVERLTARIVEAGETSGWRCGLPLEIETPGFMTGLAGIGFGLLRLAAPERVPSVLSLAPPIVD